MDRQDHEGKAPCAGLHSIGENETNASAWRRTSMRRGGNPSWQVYNFSRSTPHQNPAAIHGLRGRKHETSFSDVGHGADPLCSHFPLFNCFRPANGDTEAGGVEETSRGAARSKA